VRLWPPLNGKGIAGHERHVLFHNERGPDIHPNRGNRSRSDRGRPRRARWDFDNDGRLDVFVTNQNDNSVLLRNVNQSGHHWLEIDLRGKAPNTMR